MVACLFPQGGFSCAHSIGHRSKTSISSYPEQITQFICILTKPKKKKKAAPLKAVVQVPRILPRLVRIESDIKDSGKKVTFVFLSDVVRHFVSDLFPGHEAIGAWAFRITRNSHLYVDEEEVENLLLSIEDELHNRRRGAAVRLEIDDSIDEDVLKYLLNSLNLSEKDVLKINGPINLYRLMKLPDLMDRDDLKFPAFEAFVPKALACKENLFEKISEKTTYCITHMILLFR